MHTLTQLKAMARDWNKSNHIKIDQPKHVLLDDLRRHGVLRKKKSKEIVTPRGDELCFDEELRHVIRAMHKKYCPRVTASPSSSHRRRDHRKRKRSESLNDDV
jgi:hypothetical protein